MKQIRLFSLLVLFFIFLPACTAGQNTDLQNPISPSQSESETQKEPVETSEKERETVKIQITVKNINLIAIPEDNSSAEAFITLLQEHPVTIQMTDYAGMEKVGPLGTDLPKNDTQIKVDAGDVILYQGNQITIYYGTNTWNFTRLAVIEDCSRESLLEILGTGDVEVTFSIAEQL